MNNRFLPALILAIAMTTIPDMVYGQTYLSGKEHTNSAVGSIGRAPLRNEFMSYDTRKAAQVGERDATEYYVPLPLTKSTRAGEQIFSVAVDIPFVWVDRDLFLHVEGFPAFYVSINGTTISYSQDSKCPSEFMISSFVTDGANRIDIRVPQDGVGRRLESGLSENSASDFDLFLYSQPKVRIDDYKVTTTPDSSGKHMVFDLDVAVSNSYNSTETFIVGFDIYSPEGKLEIYDMHEVKVKGGARDTVSFRELIYHAMQKRWSVESPKLYDIAVFVRRSGRIIEYVPFKAGFGSIGYVDNKFTRNGKELEIKAASYMGASTAKQAESELRGLKLRGINTVWLAYPQPYWFYDLCDKIGVNVIDQANINFSGNTVDPGVGGTLSNDPLWEASFVERIIPMYKRNKAHACIIGISLGGNVGNGFNMYKGYQLLKAQGVQKAVLLRDASGYWNNDVEIELRDANQVLSTPAPTKQTSKKR